MKTCNFTEECKFMITKDYSEDVARIGIIRFNNQGKDIKGIVRGKVANLGTMTACNECFKKIIEYFDHILSQSDYASKGEIYLGWKP